VTNADGEDMTVAATRCGNDYAATFPATHFEHFGKVKRGVAISIFGTDETGAERTWIEKVGSLNVQPTNAESEAGDPGLAAKYLFVDAEIEDGVATLQPFENNQLDANWQGHIGWNPGDGLRGVEYSNGAWTVSFVYYGINASATADDAGAGAAATTLTLDYDGSIYTFTRAASAFTVAFADSQIEGAMRDMWFVVDSTISDAPTITWPASVEPANADSDNLVAESNAKTVFLVSEYEPGKFLVARQVVEAAA
jgi:hypothetical protein